MRLATLKKDLYFFRGGILPKGTVVQVIKETTLFHWSGGYRLLAPGGLISLVHKHELDDTVEFLADDDETGDT